MRVIQRNNARPIMAIEEWGCLAEDITWREYTKASPHVIWMWSLRKKLMEDNGRWGSGEMGGIQTLRRQGDRPSRDVIRELTKNNSTIQEMITKEKEDISVLKEENRVGADSG